MLKDSKKANSNEITIKFQGSEILERTATKFGTGAHIIVPKEYAGKKIKLIIEDENE